MNLTIIYLISGIKEFFKLIKALGAFETFVSSEQFQQLQNMTEEEIKELYNLK